MDLREYGGVHSGIEEDFVELLAAQLEATDSERMDTDENELLYFHQYPSTVPSMVRSATPMQALAGQHEHVHLEPTDEMNAENLSNHTDIQGIPWSVLPMSRHQFRDKRIRHYLNYENLSKSHDLYKPELLNVHENSEFYQFHYSTLKEKCSILHFQLRNLVWATSKHDIFYLNYGRIKHWSALHRKSTVALPLHDIQVSTIAARYGYLVAGGFLGELVIQKLESQDVILKRRITQEENAITNAVDLVEGRTHGGLYVMTCNNDHRIRFLDLSTLSQHHELALPWAVNFAQASPDRRLLCAVGDDPTGLLVDTQSGDVIAELKGHLDFSFACAWSPDGLTIATGNQDMTTRLYDLRNTSKSFAVLAGKMGAIRTLRYSHDGRFLAAAEPADFVHVYDATCNYTKSQVIDFFGEVAGISFTPEDEWFYVGTTDKQVGALLEFEKRQSPLANLII